MISRIKRVFILAVIFALTAGGSSSSHPSEAYTSSESASFTETQQGEMCPVTLSPFAQRASNKLYWRYCAEALRGFLHLNLPTADPVQQEKDTIFTLLNFAVVTQLWDLNRGHQICAVLVDQRDDSVAWIDCNSDFINNSPIDHAEARAIRNYIAQVNADAASRGVPRPPASSILRTITIYTSLEPCQMCAGTINMARAPRAVFGMKDDGFGDALDYDHAYPYHADFELNTTTRTSQELARLVAARPGVALTRIIADSQYVFDWAKQDLETYVVTYAEAQQALDNALAALQAPALGVQPLRLRDRRR